MRIPLNACRHRSEAAQGAGVQCPDRLGDRSTMIINQHALAVRVIFGMPSQVHLTHCARADPPSPGSRRGMGGQP
jgi:hypothetical protein